jgi:RimJ/RimL family protein N-acetyltransferase
MGVEVDFTGFSGHTERMLLRLYRTEDLEAFADLHGRDAVARYLPWPTRDRDASCRALAKHLAATRLAEADDGVTFAAFDPDSGRLVGEFVLFLRSVEHRGGEIGYVLHPHFQGRGLATEGARAMLQLGFETLGLHRVVARIDIRNTGSAAVLERLGMRREAVLVQNQWFKGEWGTEADYALLAEEWASTSTSSAISWKTTAPSAASASDGVRPPANP